MATKQEIEGVDYIPQEWETVVCPFCGEAKHKRYERFGDKWQYTYVKCKKCGLIYQNPRPKYDSAFVHDAYEYYAEELISNVADPIAFLEKESTREQFADFIDEILLYDKNKTAILDVGSYTGSFLYQAKKQYPICYGVDVSVRMASFIEKNLNIKVFLDKFENLDIDQKFSCINMSHVIEHIPNPKDWIEKAKTLLEKDGVLVVSVPNKLAITDRFKVFLKRIRLRKGSWASSRTPDHMYEPTVKSMLSFLANNGMEVISYKTYSRKNMVTNSFFAKIFNQRLYWGTCLRFYVKVKA